MVSHRNYFAITAIMVVVLFLFQFTNVALESWNAYESNSYAVDKKWLPGKSGSFGTEGGESGNKEGVYDTSRAVVVYIGSKDGALGKVVNTWSSYAKWQIKSYKTLEEYEDLKEQDRTDFPRMMVIDSKDMDWTREENAEGLDIYVRSGINLVFSNLPDVSVMKENRQLRRLFGISEIREDETTVAGLHLYEGFLLGGEIVYQAADETEYELRQDMELIFPWYTLTAGAKAYMAGIYEDRKLEEEECPAVIWRNRLGRGCVFAVNGNYMEDVAGLGILSAAWAQSADYAVYPVVNAQNMIIANYPGLAAENNDEMMGRYGRAMPEMMRGSVWPAIVAAYQRSSMGLSCMMAPQYDYEDDNYPDQGEFLYHMKRLAEQRAEVGLSGTSTSEISLDEKLKEDALLMEENIPGYKFASFYGNGLSDDVIDEALSGDFLGAVRTVVTGYDGDSEVIGYQSEHVTRQKIISNGSRHTFLEDFRVRAVETALGYTSVLADIAPAANPVGKDDTFDKIIADFGWNTQHYWQNFQEFSGTTVSECDEHIRGFLAMDYKESRENNSIRLEIAGPQMPVWFILRTGEGTIDKVTGGTWKKVEEQVYLIEAQESSVVIQMK